MAIAPDARRNKRAGPEAAPGTAGGALLTSVVICRDRQTGLDHLRAEVPPRDAAPGQNTAEPIVSIGQAKRRLASDNRDQAVARNSTARPVASFGIGAALVQFRRIHPQDTNALITQMKAVTVADACPTRKRRLRGGQSIYQYGTASEYQNCQYGAKTAAEGAPMDEVCQLHFTAC